MQFILTYKIFQIKGDSLYPELKNGEFVLAKKTNKYKVDDIVIFKKDIIYIKKIKKINQNFVYVVGTDAFSIDSRVFGEIHIDEILYKVVLKLPKIFNIGKFLSLN